MGPSLKASHPGAPSLTPPYAVRQDTPRDGCAPGPPQAGSLQNFRWDRVRTPPLLLGRGGGKGQSRGYKIHARKNAIFFSKLCGKKPKCKVSQISKIAKNCVVFSFWRCCEKIALMSRTEKWILYNSQFLYLPLLLYLTLEKWGLFTATDDGRHFAWGESSDLHFPHFPAFPAFSHKLGIFSPSIFGKIRPHVSAQFRTPAFCRTMTAHFAPSMKQQPHLFPPALGIHAGKNCAPEFPSEEKLRISFLCCIFFCVITPNCILCSTIFFFF